MRINEVRVNPGVPGALERFRITAITQHEGDPCAQASRARGIKYGLEVRTLAGT